MGGLSGGGKRWLYSYSLIPRPLTGLRMRLPSQGTSTVHLHILVCFFASVYQGFLHWKWHLPIYTLPLLFFSFSPFTLSPSPSFLSLPPPSPPPTFAPTSPHRPSQEAQRIFSAKFPMDKEAISSKVSTCDLKLSLVDILKTCHIAPSLSLVPFLPYSSLPTLLLSLPSLPSLSPHPPHLTSSALPTLPTSPRLLSPPSPPHLVCSPRPPHLTSSSLPTLPTSPLPVFSPIAVRLWYLGDSRH